MKCVSMLEWIWIELNLHANLSCVNLNKFKCSSTLFLFDWNKKKMSWSVFFSAAPTTPALVDMMVWGSVLVLISNHHYHPHLVNFSAKLSNSQDKIKMYSLYYWMICSSVIIFLDSLSRYHMIIINIINLFTLISQQSFF